jgi:hypothetical protein
MIRVKAILQQNVDTMTPAGRSGTNAGAFLRGGMQNSSETIDERNLRVQAGLGNTNGVNR